MDVHIARQPILDRSSAVQGYELLFRGGRKSAPPLLGNEQASSHVIVNSLFFPRIDVLRHGKDAFFNVSRELLVSDCLTALPKAHTVLQILESVAVDRDVLAACRALKNEGYRFALDRFCFQRDRMPLVEFADVIKVDPILSDPRECAVVAKKSIHPGTRLLAEKVNSKEMYKRLLDFGYDLFQGYFFAQPTIVKGRDIPTSQTAYMQILREVNRRELDSSAICSIVEGEVGLSYKLLRYVNSAGFGWQGAISSIRHAILLLGQNEVRRWATLIALAGISTDEPEEIIVMSLVRARFCELLAPLVDLGHRSDDLYLAGLFSMIDVALKCPLDEAFHDMPIDPEVKNAIVRGDGLMGKILRAAVSYSEGDWETFSKLANELSILENDVPGLYDSALDFCNGRMGVIQLDRAA
jgi:c-di-GMP-related signal transduction protein